MDERNQRVLCARPRHFVDEPYATTLEVRKRGRQIVNAKRDVVQARTAFVDILGDRRIGRRGLQQFEARGAGVNEVRAHLLRCHFFGAVQIQSKRIPEEGQRRREVGHGDADVIEIRFHTCVGDEGAKNTKDLL